MPPIINKPKPNLTYPIYKVDRYSILKGGEKELGHLIAITL